MELWDLYTSDGMKTDRVIDRYGKERIPKGLYHLSCHVLVRHTDGDILLMLRAKSKREYGGCYECTSGGSALSGETAQDCIRRELFEETGLNAGELELVDVGLSEKYRAIFYSYVTVVSCDKDSVRLLPGETEGYKWIHPDELDAFVRSGSGIDILTDRFRSYFLKNGLIKG